MSGLISIIVPVYKVDESILRKTINSVIKQNYSEFELILVDDGSPDTAGTICDGFAKTDNRIRVIHKSNGGVSSARNAGLEAVHGDYITFVDSDDFLEPDYLDYLFRLLTRNDADISICCCNYINSEKRFKTNNQRSKHIVLNQAEAIKHLCYMIQYYTGNETTAVWGKMYKREIVSGIRFDENMTIGEDFAFNYSCYRNVDRVVIGDARKYNYRISDNGLMRGSYTQKKGKGLDSLIIMRDQRHGDYENAVVCRLINIAIIMLLMIPKDQYLSDRDRLIDFINKDRIRVLRDKDARKKVKISLLLSYLGYDKMQSIFNLINR